MQKKEEKRAFYFTYGAGNSRHPFFGGWTKVIAQDPVKAVSLYHVRHPQEESGYAAMYGQKEFVDAGFPQKGNFGSWCHETIVSEAFEGDMPVSPEEIVSVLKAYLKLDAAASGEEGARIPEKLARCGCGEKLARYLGYDFPER